GAPPPVAPPRVEPLTPGASSRPKLQSSGTTSSLPPRATGKLQSSAAGGGSGVAEPAESPGNRRDAALPPRSEAATEMLPRTGGPDDPRRLLGTVLGGYRIDGEVAKGGMGVVYRATQLSMDRLVALKVLSRKFGTDETFKKRFIREARAAAVIEHPNIIKVYDAGEERDETFFAMELIDGEDAEGVVIKGGPLEPLRAA